MTARVKPKPTRTTRRRVPPTPTGLSEQLRRILESRGVSAYALDKAADLDPGVVARFLDGRRGLTLASADRLAAALGIRLVEAPGRRRRGTAT